MYQAQWYFFSTNRYPRVAPARTRSSAELKDWRYFVCFYYLIPPRSFHVTPDDGLDNISPYRDLNVTDICQHVITCHRPCTLMLARVKMGAKDPREHLLGVKKIKCKSRPRNSILVALRCSSQNFYKRPVLCIWETPTPPPLPPRGKRSTQFR